MAKVIEYYCEKGAWPADDQPDAHWVSVGDGWLPVNRKPEPADYDAVAALFAERVENGRRIITVRHAERDLHLRFGLKPGMKERIEC